MKCWIDGSKCSWHSGDSDEGGLLEVNTGFCVKCSTLIENLSMVKPCLGDIGIELFQESEKPLIDEEDQSFLADNASVVLMALSFIEKGIREDNPEIIKEIEEKCQLDEWIEGIHEGLGIISKLEKIFEKIKD